MAKSNTKKAVVDTSDKTPEEKQKALETAISQIEKSFGKGTIIKMGENPKMNVSSVSTGSISLDMALGIGGLPKGRIVEVYGPESSGKTTLTLHAIAEVQKTGGQAAFIDAEHTVSGQIKVVLDSFASVIIGSLSNISSSSSVFPLG